MSVEGGPDIVNDGLVLYLDAGNTKSYPGSGIVWKDLSGNGNNGTLVNGVGYSNTNGGSLTFDGSNDYVDMIVPQLSNIATVEMITKIMPTRSSMIFGFQRYDIWYSGGQLGYNTFASDRYGFSSQKVSELNLIGNQVHYIFEMNSGIPYTNNKIYINGVSQQLQQVAGNTRTPSFGDNSLRISTSASTPTNYIMKQQCFVFKVYNRALTSQEILQNYKATKGRYGL